MVKILNMNDPKKKILQLISDTAKTRGDITQSPSAWQHFKSDLNSIIKYPFQSLRSKMKTGNIPYNLSGAIESGNTKSQPMDTAFDMVNVPGAVLNLGQKVFSGNASTTDMVIAGASMLPIGKVFRGAKNYITGNKVKAINSQGQLVNVSRNQTQVIQRIEDAAAGQYGTTVKNALSNPAGKTNGIDNYNIGNWFSSNKDNVYNNRLFKDAYTGNLLKNSNKQRRIIETRFTKDASNTFSASNPSANMGARNMSGGGTRYEPVFSEKIIPPSLTNQLRNEIGIGLSKANKVTYGNESQINKVLTGPNNIDKAKKYASDVLKKFTLFSGTNNVIKK